MTLQTEGQSQDVQRVLDAMMQGVLIISPSGLVGLINHEACRILEAASETAHSRDLASLIPGNDRVLEAVEKVRTSQRSRAEGEVVLRRRSGSEVLLDITLSPLVENESEIPDVLLVDIAGLARDPGICVKPHEAKQGSAKLDEAARGWTKDRKRTDEAG